MNELEKITAELAELRRKYNELLNTHVLHKWAASQIMRPRTPKLQELH